MLKRVMNTLVYYEFINNNKEETIILLHGWGQNTLMMKPLGDKFLNEYNVLYIDLPGFGSSCEPNYSWTIYDYARCINQFVKDLNFNKYYIIGHSFGGRIGLLYSSLYNVNKLICIASPFKKNFNKLPLKTKIYKFFKKIPFLRWASKIIAKHIGSIDYKNASSIMKSILVKSINLDMTNDIKKINIPILLIWGTNDTAVKIDYAYELNSLITDSKLIVYKNKTHYVYLEELDSVYKKINKFLKG